MFCYDRDRHLLTQWEKGREVYVGTMQNQFKKSMFTTLVLPGIKPGTCALRTNRWPPRPPDNTYDRSPWSEFGYNLIAALSAMKFF